jgi:hypothetical protein
MSVLADRNRDGIPDMLEGAGLVPPPPAQSPATNRPVAPPAASVPTTGGEVKTAERNVRLLVVGGALV